MNFLREQDRLLELLPERLAERVLWVYPRLYYKDVEVAFQTCPTCYPETYPHIIRVPWEWWLDERGLAYICLNAP